jgi:tripartite-type tricarboxylate transporter receptor subunit TctC
MRHLRLLLGVVILAAATIMPVTGQAAYPDRPITMIVPYGAGGITDILGRIYATALGRELGVSVVVKNVAGSAATLGVTEMVKAKPDGYTILYSPSSSIVLQPHLRKGLPYTADTPVAVCQVMRDNQILWTSPKAPWKTFQEMVEIIKKEPGKYFFCSTAAGNLPHIAQATLFKDLGLDVKLFPAASGAAAIQALYANTAQFYMEFVGAGKGTDMIPLAVFGSERLPGRPETPSLEELGIKLPPMHVWHGIFVPQNTPGEIMEKLESASKKASESEEMKAGFDKLTTPIVYLPREQFQKDVLKDFASMGSMLKELDLLPKE